MQRREFTDYLKNNGFSYDEAVSEVDFAIEILTSFRPSDFIKNIELSDNDYNIVRNAIKQRILTKKPIQQIVGQAFFMGNRYFVNEYTLIPRPESEIIIEECFKKIVAKSNIRVLDIGTGSGCLAVEIANNPAVEDIIAVDICENALDIAQKNAAYHNVGHKIKFIHSDLFSKIDEKFDIIVSNPPYIPLKEKQRLQPEVRDFEPESALFASDDEGVEFYEKIIMQSAEYLNEGGFIIFELGINQSDIVKKLFEKNGFKNIEIIKDLNLIDRVIIAQIKS